MSMHLPLMTGFVDNDRKQPRLRLGRVRRWMLSAALAVSGSVLHAEPPTAPTLTATISPPSRSEATPAVSRSWSLRQTPVVEVVKHVRDAVVNIHSERTVPAGADGAVPSTGPHSRVNGMGTGILIDPRGYI
ncbi:MAG: hypothetical protein ACRELF_20920, partial [Gemmataceae bacterium]